MPGARAARMGGIWSTALSWCLNPAYPPPWSHRPSSVLCMDLVRRWAGGDRVQCSFNQSECFLMSGHRMLPSLSCLYSLAPPPSLCCSNLPRHPHRHTCLTIPVPSSKAQASIHAIPMLSSLPQPQSAPSQLTTSAATLRGGRGKAQPPAQGPSEGFLLWLGHGRVTGASSLSGKQDG